MTRAFGVVYMALAAIVVALPIIVVSAAALNNGRSMLFPPQDPTLARFTEFFVTEPVWTNALQNSILIATASAALAVMLAWQTVNFSSHHWPSSSRSCISW